MYDGKSDKSGSTCARTGENGLDRAASKGLATSAAATACASSTRTTGRTAARPTNSGSTRAPAGENGLDRAASKVFATSVAVTMARLQLYQNDAANGGVDEEEAAQGYLGRALVKLLAISLEIVVGLFVFGRVIPRRSSWRRARPGARPSSATCLFGRRSPSWRRRRLRSAAATTPLQDVPRIPSSKTT